MDTLKYITVVNFMMLKFCIVFRSAPELVAKTWSRIEDNFFNLFIFTSLVIILHLIFFNYVLIELLFVYATMHWPILGLQRENEEKV